MVTLDVPSRPPGKCPRSLGNSQPPLLDNPTCSLFFLGLRWRGRSSNLGAPSGPTFSFSITNHLCTIRADKSHLLEPCFLICEMGMFVAFLPLSLWICLTFSLSEIYLFFPNFTLSFCIWVQLINNVVVVSDEQQRDSDIHVPVSILPPNPLPSRLAHNVERSFTCYTICPCWLSILNIAVGS